MSTEKEELWKVEPLLERLRRIITLVKEERTITAAFMIKRLAIDLDKQGQGKRLKAMLQE